MAALGAIVLWLLFLGIIVGSVWGGIVLAKKIVKDRLGSVLLGLVFAAVMFCLGCTALIAGCIAVTGPPNFH